MGMLSSGEWVSIRRNVEGASAKLDTIKILVISALR